jgi:hypothetical protein
MKMMTMILVVNLKMPTHLMIMEKKKVVMMAAMKNKMKKA